ncbi:LpqB family beta-propeller domain-containing protein, partial [Streptomyces sp. URMC 129]|uniref:LpqB family beta-propeller domain-containing protein n=1 Tax=Streptomyces sp. URMC 129 TaxID=3423407 RepID=UPI003F1E2AB7
SAAVSIPDRRGRGPGRGRGRGQGRRWGLFLLAGALLLSGCASMPGSGPVQRVDSEERPDSESLVRVYGVAPQDGALPQQIVRGFLEAVTSDDEEFETARQYLTPERADSWDPFAGITVLSSGLGLSSPRGEDSRVELNGARLATVDDAHVYTPQAGAYRGTFDLRKVEGEWRIDALPDGLVMSDADFRRIYRSVDTYYYADLGAEASRTVDGVEVLVPDPVYVRRRIDPVGDAVRALLDGPSAWHDPVVTTAFPEDTGLAGGAAINDSGTLTLRLEGVPDDLAGHRCELMATQLLQTVREVASQTLTEALLLDEEGAQLCTISRAEADGHTPGLSEGEVARAYFLDEDGRLVSVVDDESPPRPVRGPLGEPAAELRSVAVSRDEQRGAGVSASGSALYVASTYEDDAELRTVLTSESGGEQAGLSAPSWDGLGDLWVADRDPDGPRLLRLPGGVGEPQEVAVAGLGEGQRIEAVRVASDGVRIAMLVSGDGHTTLQLGRVERTRADGAGVVVSVEALRPVAPEMEDVAAASWAGGSRLVVVGRPENGVEQLHYVATDGSPLNAPSVPGLNDVTAVAAAEDERQPLLAQTGDDIARLQDDAQWKLVADAKGGFAPVYPG